MTVRERYVKEVVAALTRLGGEARRHEIVENAYRLGRWKPEEYRPAPAGQGYRDAIVYRLNWAITAAKLDGEIERVGYAVWRLKKGD